MIKIKILDMTDAKCFGALLVLKDVLRDYSIDITDSNDYDYEFVSGREFVDLSLPLQESIDWGIENLSKKSGDYFIFHAGDSPQIMGAYEVFVESKAKFMFKKFLLSQEDYKIPSVIGKWFWGSDGPEVDKGYDIPDDIYSRMKLQGFNVTQTQLGFTEGWPWLNNMIPIDTNRDIDVCAIYRGILNDPNLQTGGTSWTGKIYDHQIRSDTYYTEHRTGAWNELDKIKDKYKIVQGHLSPQHSEETMVRSKISISPFGMAEVCNREVELTRAGCLLIKPDMSKVLAEPDWLKANETYVPVKLDWSDLNETIEKILENFGDYQHIIHNAREKMIESYSYKKLCMYWYNFFTTLSGVGNE